MLKDDDVGHKYELITDTLYVTHKTYQVCDRRRNKQRKNKSKNVRFVYISRFNLDITTTSC
jgi:hypothetical protein